MCNNNSRKKKIPNRIYRSERHLVCTICVIRLMCCLTNPKFLMHSHTYNMCNVSEKQQAGQPRKMKNHTIIITDRSIDSSLFFFIASPSLSVSVLCFINFSVAHPFRSEVNKIKSAKRWWGNRIEKILCFQSIESCRTVSPLMWFSIDRPIIYNAVTLHIFFFIFTKLNLVHRMPSSNCLYTHRNY